MLKFEKEGLIALNFYMERLSFPVAVAAYSDMDIVKINYLDETMKKENTHTTRSICIWCINQKIKYQIVFPPILRSFISNPIRT